MYTFAHMFIMSNDYLTIIFNELVALNCNVWMLKHSMWNYVVRKLSDF